jgi:hypothetical protein
MALRLRISTALFIAAFAAIALIAGFATASHATITAGGMGPHSVGVGGGVIQPDPIVILDR